MIEATRPLFPAEPVPAIGPQRITLKQNGAMKQDGTLADLIRQLSQFYHPPPPHDLIYTGTPSGG